ncbi:CAP domain-containing protein [Myceligenerans indicum]|uniref:CAP domain-containing protein n=1 Tax=Myceligenerans indicum TaxID=2593663 RepID=A0ABS1LMP0_9MICO|nr:CAP domain-containing protein [Myceligenerans indicum]MBL0887542.1 CAP domain-containing protein [Myceligenerans indicum]
MGRRPNTPDLEHVARPPATARIVVPLLSVATAVALSACSVTFNPGPGEAAFEAGSWQIGEAAGSAHHTATPGTSQESEDDSRPVSVSRHAASFVEGVGSSTIKVRPAPERSPDAADGRGEDPPAAGGGGSGGGGDGTVSAGTNLSDPVQYARVLEAEVNQRREAHGVTALAHDDCAYDIALERAEALRGKALEHAPLDPIFDRCPTSTVGENLARGGWSPSEAADGWMNSEGHRANILNAGFTRGAIACISEESSYGPEMTCAHVFLG